MTLTELVAAAIEQLDEDIRNGQEVDEAINEGADAATPSSTWELEEVVSGNWNMFVIVRPDICADDDTPDAMIRENVYQHISQALWTWHNGQEKEEEGACLLEDSCQEVYMACLTCTKGGV